MSTVGASAGGVLARKKFEQAKSLAQYFISKGFNNPSHTLTALEIDTYIKENNLGLLNFLNSWKNLPFIIGDDKYGYWFSEEKLMRFINAFWRSVKLMIVFAISCFVIAIIIYIITNGLSGHPF